MTRGRGRGRGSWQGRVRAPPVALAGGRGLGRRGGWLLAGLGLLDGQGWRHTLLPGQGRRGQRLYLGRVGACCRTFERVTALYLGGKGAAFDSSC